MEAEVGAREGASVTRELDACSVQDCEDGLCSGDFGAVAGDDLEAAAEDAESITERKPRRPESRKDWRTVVMASRASFILEL